jgi:hypothetical protein
MGEDHAANSAMNLVRFLLDCVPAICASTGLRFRHDSEFICFFFLFFNDSLVVFWYICFVCSLTSPAKLSKTQQRERNGNWTEREGKGREGKGREGMRRDFFVVVVVVATILFTRVLVPSNQ